MFRIGNVLGSFGTLCLIKVTHMQTVQVLLRDHSGQIRAVEPMHGESFDVGRVWKSVNHNEAASTQFIDSDPKLLRRQVGYVVVVIHN